jgi:hypothetical protein
MIQFLYQERRFWLAQGRGQHNTKILSFRDGSDPSTEEENEKE